MFDSRVVLSVPEGFSRFQIASRTDALGLTSEKQMLDAIENPKLVESLVARLRTRGGIDPTRPVTSLEGYLFPDTYRFDRGTSAEVIASTMVENFFARAAPLLEMAAGRPAHDVTVLASMIEREAVVAEERSIIAGVFMNRMLFSSFPTKRLQSDPTVAYGCLFDRNLASCKSFDGRRVTRVMTEDATNPYNTYRRAGLPPGPISNPGLASISAAALPSSHSFLYFVASGQGRHTFSATYEEHLKAVARWRTLSN